MLYAPELASAVINEIWSGPQPEGEIPHVRFEPGGAVRIWDGVEAVDRRDWTDSRLGTLFGVTSFGVDALGEVYVLTADGVVRRIVEG